MARLRSPILWLGIATVVVTVAWFVVTPRRAWQDFLRSLAQNDYTLMQSVVDNDALRVHALEDLKAAVTVRMGRQPTTGPIRDEVMRAMVNSMLSPKGLLDLVNGFSVPSGPGGEVRTAFHYRGLSQVDVLLGGTGSDNTGAGLFTFERTGLHWRLTRASSLRVAAMTAVH